MANLGGPPRALGCTRKGGLELLDNKLADELAAAAEPPALMPNNENMKAKGLNMNNLIGNQMNHHAGP